MKQGKAVADDKCAWWGCDYVFEIADPVWFSGESDELVYCSTTCLLKDGSDTEFARVTWTIDDILTLQPDWTRQEVRDWFEKNEKYIIDRITELGWEVIGELT